MTSSIAVSRISDRAASVAIRRDDLAPISTPQRLPDRQADRFLHERDVPVAESPLDAAGMLAPRGHVQRQPAPQRVSLVAVGKTAAAVDLAIVGCPAVVVHTMPRRSIVPFAAPGHLESERGGRDDAEGLVVGV